MERERQSQKGERYLNCEQGNADNEAEVQIIPTSQIPPERTRNDGVYLTRYNPSPFTRSCKFRAGSLKEMFMVLFTRQLCRGTFNAGGKFLSQ